MRRTLVLLVLVVAAVACRTIVQPEPLLEPLPVDFVVVDPNGVGVANSNVWVEAEGDPRRFTWSGRTNDLGRVYLSVPYAGPFSVRVSPGDAQVPPFTFYGVNLRGSGHVLRYEMQPISGTLVVPSELLPFTGGTNLGLEYWIDVGGNSYYHQLRPRLSPQGVISGWSRPRAYLARAEIYNSQGRFYYEWPDSAVVEADGTLNLVLPMVSFEVLPTLGGDPVFLGADLRVTTETFAGGGTNGTVRVDAELAPRMDLWAVPGTVRVSFQDSSLFPFNGRSQLFDIQGGESFTFNLGEYRLDVSVVDGAGAPRAQAQLSFGDAQDTYPGTDTSTGVDGRAPFFLDAGEYLVWGRIQSDFDWVGLGTLAVTGDASVEFVLP